MGQVRGAASATCTKNFEDPCSGHQLKSTQECMGCRQFKFLHKDSVPLKMLDDYKHKGVLLFKVLSYLNST